MIWFFKKRAFSVYRGFEDLIVEDEEDDVRGYMGQVDLNDKPIYRWILVGFWADLNGKYESWSVELS